MSASDPADAVAWHSKIATRFDARYAASASFRERAAVWSRLIAAHVDAGGTVIDAGCGPGLFTDMAAARARHVLAFDASPEMVALTRARLSEQGRTNVDLRTGRLGEAGLLDGLRDGPAAGAPFDVVLCSSVLEYVPDLWEAVDWLAGLLRPGGTAILSMPNGLSLYRRAERLVFRATGRPAYYAHVRHVPRPDAFRAGLEARGLTVRSLAYYGATPLASPLARALGRPERGDALFVVVCEKIR